MLLLKLILWGGTSMGMLFFLLIVGTAFFLSTKYFIKSERNAKNLLFGSASESSMYVTCNKCGQKNKRTSLESNQCSNCHTYF